MRKILLISSFFPLSFLTIFASLALLTLQVNSKAKIDMSRSVSKQEEKPDSAITDMLYMENSTSDSGSVIRNFLARYHSPLEPYADYIVEVSNSYGIDPRLIPAIAMQESNLCKKAPENSFNCWGYGIYGGKIRNFSSFKDGIEAVAFSLSQNYVKKGFATIEQIMSKYTPNNTNNWVVSVAHFMSQME